MKHPTVRALIQQIISFAGVGLVTTVLQYLILIFLVQIFIIKPVYASTVGYLISALVSYYLNYVFTFRSTARHHVAMAKFLFVVTVGLSLNAAVMYWLTEVLSLFVLV